MIRGVCFDMDGLLFDTERMGAEVMDQAAALQGCSLTEEQWRSVIGQSLAATQTALCAAGLASGSTRSVLWMTGAG